MVEPHFIFPITLHEIPYPISMLMMLITYYILKSMLFPKLAKFIFVIRIYFFILIFVLQVLLQFIIKLPLEIFLHLFFCLSHQFFHFSLPLLFFFSSFFVFWLLVFLNCLLFLLKYFNIRTLRMLFHNFGSFLQHFPARRIFRLDFQHNFGLLINLNFSVLCHVYFSFNRSVRIGITKTICKAFR